MSSLGGCPNCGADLVCPKCTPVVEQAEIINIQHKGPYNAGLPNHLIIFPSYSDGNRHESVAMLVGDNFYWKPHWFSRGISVVNMAHWLANSDDYHYLAEKFDLSRGQVEPFKDLQVELRKKYGSGVAL